MPGQSARENGKLGGRPKGTTGIKHKATIDKILAREVLRQHVLEHMRPMVQAQIVNSLGIGHLYTRDKQKKFTKIEDQAQVDRLLATGTEGTDYWIFTKDPSIQAFTDLMNRALDKPKEQPQDFHVTATVRIADVLKQRHDRHRKPE